MRGEIHRKTTRNVSPHAAIDGDAASCLRPWESDCGAVRRASTAEGKNRSLGGTVSDLREEVTTQSGVEEEVTFYYDSETKQRMKKRVLKQQVETVTRTERVSVSVEPVGGRRGGREEEVE